jgi:uncharacterized protein (DUF885 family)
MASCSPAPEPAAPRSAEFAAFADRYFDGVHEWSPSQATANGFHEYDGKLEDRSAAAVAARVLELKERFAELEGLRKGLSGDDAIDADLIGAAIRAELLDLETGESWKRNPMLYVYLPGNGIDGLMKRNFAPAPERLRSVISRLKGVPPLLAAMKANVENPPKEFTDLAIRMAGGSVGFFRGSIAGWAKEAAGGDAALLAEFQKANAAAAQAMEEAARWLRLDLLPRSKGNYAIGAELFSKKLLYEEMVDLPLERILAIGEANLEKDYQALVALAKEIDPAATPEAVIAGITKEHPTEATLVEDTKRTIEEARQFLIDRKIVTVPSEVRPTILETPPYARSGGFASMDTPGAYETKATEAFYYVTPPEKDWPAKTKEEHLKLFNPPVLKMITVHEAYPGHYLQFLYAKQFPTKARKLLFCGSNAEGWAHYAEQMMVEEGFGGGDKRIRLAQLKEALIRDCRYVAGIKLHTQGWTVEQATKLFMEKAFEERAVAFEEARRGTYNPTYLYYTLGKLMIYKLREDYRKAMGSGYSLERFHNEFVRQGGIPLKLVRRILLHGDAGPLL